MTLALLLRIAIPPVLVALMSMAARRWGPTIGGLIMGLPWMTGPVLFFLALDKGDDFAIRACTGIELATWGIAAFVLAFSIASRWFAWPLCLLAALASYFGIAYFTQDLSISLLAASAGAVAALTATFLLLPKPGPTTTMGPLPWWDIPARMLATASVVTVIVISADLLGPQRSGIVASYPVIITVIGSFTLSQWGRPALVRIFRGFTQSLQGFVAFFAVLGYTLPHAGLIPAFLISAAAAVAVSLAFMAWNRYAPRLRLTRH